ncbi:MAG: Rid family detoxifying hydrolase [Syntrophales bacterium]|nr:Rid family detoxifying hydrolase [Syntrophales bacterium]
MTAKIILPTPIPAAGPYSQAVMVGNLIFCAGQIPIDLETGEVIKDDIRKATACCLKNLTTILETYGSRTELVIKTTVYLTDMNHFPLMNEVYSRFFSTSPPARTTVAVSALPKGAPIEIEAIALKDG